MSGFNLFVYGTLQSGTAGAELLEGSNRIGSGTVAGTLYDIDGRFPALVRYGEGEVRGEVRGEVWRCPSDLLLALDRYEGTEEGLFRRIADEVQTERGPLPCWLYAAGPALSRKLTPDRRIAGGRWDPPSAQRH